jgi:hypothetical protein
VATRSPIRANSSLESSKNVERKEERVVRKRKITKDCNEKKGERRQVFID